MAVIGAGAVIASIICCGGLLSLERTLCSRGGLNAFGLNFLLTGKPEALSTSMVDVRGRASVTAAIIASSPGVGMGSVH